MTEQQEKKSRRIALASSLGIHGVLLLLFFLIAAWRAPNPPLPEYGIELNFGMDDQGTGEVQPTTPVGTEQSDQEEEVNTSPEESATPEQTEVTGEENITPAETKPEAPQVTSQAESPEVVKEGKDVKPVEKPVEKSTEAKEEIKPEEEAKAVYRPDTKPTTEDAAKGKAGTQASQGDAGNKNGDQGDPQGTLDAKALYGKEGGGGGGVSMSGFNGFAWPKVETPALPNEAYGIYEFTVKVDDQGVVISVTAAQRGLSIEAERRLKAAIQKLQFVPKGSNLPVQSEGRITFKVVSSKN
jgi:outer membrane biosynthesis protein TonB